MACYKSEIEIESKTALAEFGEVFLLEGVDDGLVGHVESDVLLPQLLHVYELVAELGLLPHRGVVDADDAQLFQVHQRRQQLVVVLREPRTQVLQLAHRARPALVAEVLGEEVEDDLVGGRELMEGGQKQVPVDLVHNLRKDVHRNPLVLEVVILEGLLKGLLLVDQLEDGLPEHVEALPDVG